MLRLNVEKLRIFLPWVNFLSNAITVGAAVYSLAELAMKHAL